jgi:hypothetical protein
MGTPDLIERLTLPFFAVAAPNYKSAFLNAPFSHI